MTDEITRLAREYTQETANLKDYQCQARSAKFGRLSAKRNIEPGYFQSGVGAAKQTANTIGVDIEECDPSDETFYIWALVPEYNSYGHAKVVLRRVGTIDGELILPPEERAEKRLKLSDRETRLLKSRTLKGIIPKIKNCEAQIKAERGRLAEQIKKGDKVYMEAEAVELKRICERMQEDLDDFLDMLSRP